MKTFKPIVTSEMVRADRLRRMLPLKCNHVRVRRCCGACRRFSAEHHKTTQRAS